MSKTFGVFPHFIPLGSGAVRSVSAEPRTQTKKEKFLPFARGDHL